MSAAGTVRVHTFDPGTSPTTIRMLADMVCEKSPEFGKPLACGCTDGKNARLICPEHASQDPKQTDGSHLPTGSVQGRINVLEAALRAARNELQTHAFQKHRLEKCVDDIDKLLNPPKPEAAP